MAPETAEMPSALAVHDGRASEPSPQLPDAVRTADRLPRQSPLRPWADGRAVPLRTSHFSLEAIWLQARAEAEAGRVHNYLHRGTNPKKGPTPVSTVV